MRAAQARAAVAAAVLVAVAACAGPGSGTVYSSSFTVSYDPRSLSALMARAPLLVETYGAPAPGQSSEDVARATTLALRQHGPAWLPRNFTASAADAGNPRYRLRIAYSMPKAFDRQRICTAAMDDALLEAERTEADVGSTRTVASLCRGERTIGVATGSPGARTDIAGEGFARFVGFLGREVMPRHNPVMDDDCAFRFCN